MYENIHITHHGSKRLQNRAIPAQVINWLLDFGNYVPQRHNTQLIHFTKSGREKLTQQLSTEQKRLLEKKSHAYMVLGDDNVLITAGYRTKRIPRS